MLSAAILCFYSTSFLFARSFTNTTLCVLGNGLTRCCRHSTQRISSHYYNSPFWYCCTALRTSPEFVYKFKVETFVELMLTTINLNYHVKFGKRLRDNRCLPFIVLSCTCCLPTKFIDISNFLV